MRTEDYKDDGMRALHALCRHETHGGYAWAAVMSDGELMCVKCLRKNYRQIFTATGDPRDRTGWGVIGHANSGDSDETAYCCNCNQPVWTKE
jgi:hypothetical protein